MTTFTAKKGINEVEFNATESGFYGILKNESVLGLIEVVDDLESTDIEKVREKFLE